MTAAACQLEIDLFAVKAQRAATRRQNLLKKRSDYLRSRLARSQPPVRALEFSNSAEHARVKPHRILRSATRTCLAKGILETPSDIPCLVSVGRNGRAAAPRKPTVATVLTYARSEATPEEPKCCSQEYLDWFRSCARADSSTDDSGLDLALDLAEAATTATEASDADAAGSEPEEELPGAGSPELSPAVEPEEEFACEAEAGWELLPCGARDVEAEGLGWSLVA
eukprot:CAMPEP_0171228416 /NCGR_PEP_ID=MMETSP0790-20130122/38354_1 /TAXON_ID=2925 /ORGANISM="Alexandrium catenella, Strain OF101" /LENGTH=224 /DNA_ID=CAMNT_0011694565 /DNA_START=94 /DNA_END=768 /DNA_ORIENTATION=-